MTKPPRLLSVPATHDATNRSIPKAPTGIAGFDEIAGGGVPRGRPTLVCGAAGCGKTLFSLEFLVRGALEFGEPGVLVSFEETPAEIAANVRSIGFDVTTLLEQGMLAADYMQIDAGLVRTGAFDLEGLFARIDDAVQRVGAKRLVLDTLEVLFAGIGDDGLVRSELARLFRWTKERGLTTVLTGERGTMSLTRHGLEEYVSDCVVLLEHEIVDRASSRRLRLLKYRGTSHGTDEYPFLIDEYGFSVLPITEMSFDVEAPEERISTGVADLDKLFGGGGGIYRGSGVLISGSSGTGKSTLAAHFAAAACARDEHVLVFGFEESPQQTIRNMRSVGLDLAPYVADGRLTFEARRPARQGLDNHLVRMQRLVEQFHPKLVVVDPISALLHAGSELDARAAVVRLSDHLKARAITAVFTSLGSGEQQQDGAHVYVSSIMDTWIDLRGIESNGERNRGLHILKARGMKHSNQIREFVLGDDGVSLLEPVPGAIGLTGSARIEHAAELRAKRLLRDREIQTAKDALERRRRALESQKENLVAEFEAEENKLRAMIAEAELLAAEDDRTRRLVAEHVAAPGDKKSP